MCGAQRHALRAIADGRRLRACGCAPRILHVFPLHGRQRARALHAGSMLRAWAVWCRHAWCRTAGVSGEARAHLCRLRVLRRYCLFLQAYM